MLKLKMMLCVMMLPLVVVGCTSSNLSVQCVTTASGVDNASLPIGEYRWSRMFTLEEEVITMQKQLEEPEKY